MALNQRNVELIEPLHSAGARLRNHSTLLLKNNSIMQSDIFCCLISEPVFELFMESDPKSFEGINVENDAHNAFNFYSYDDDPLLHKSVFDRLLRIDFDFEKRGEFISRHTVKYLDSLK